MEPFIAQIIIFFIRLLAELLYPGVFLQEVPV